MSEVKQLGIQLFVSLSEMYNECLQCLIVCLGKFADFSDQC